MHQLRQLALNVTPLSFILLWFSVFGFIPSFSILLQVHSSLNGKNFKSRMNAEHIDLLHSPWLIELGAFYLNSSGLDNCELDGVYGFFSCDLSITKAVMTLVLPDSINLEYDLTCAICLVIKFLTLPCSRTKEKILYISVSLLNVCIVIW